MSLVSLGGSAFTSASTLARQASASRRTAACGSLTAACIARRQLAPRIAAQWQGEEVADLN